MRSYRAGLKGYRNSIKKRKKYGVETLELAILTFIQNVSALFFLWGSDFHREFLSGKIRNC